MSPKSKKIPRIGTNTATIFAILLQLIITACGYFILQLDIGCGPGGACIIPVPLIIEWLGLYLITVGISVATLLIFSKSFREKAAVDVLMMTLGLIFFGLIFWSTFTNIPARPVVSIPIVESRGPLMLDEIEKQQAAKDGLPQ